MAVNDETLPRLVPQDTGIRLRRFVRALVLVGVQQRADEAMVIGRVIDQMQQNVLVDHPASTATDKMKRIVSVSSASDQRRARSF